jgi:putative membrane protein
MPSDPAAPEPMPSWPMPPGRRRELDGTARRTSTVTVAFHAVYGAIGVLMLLPEELLSSRTGGSTAEEPGGWNQLVVFGAILVVSQLYAVAGWATTTYAVGADRLVVDSGILTRHRRVLPYGRVQQVDIGQRLLQRLVGYATVKVSTAGESDAASVQLGLLDLALADLIRTYILEQRERLQAAAVPPPFGAEPGDPATSLPPPAPPAVLVRIETGQLVLAALTRHAALVLVPAVAVVVPLLAAAALAPAGTAWTEAATSIVVITAIGAGLMFVVLTVNFVLGYHGYTLTRRGDDLHLHSGLTQVSDATLPRRRVQVVTVLDNPLWRWLGLVALELRSAAPVTGGGDRDKVSTSSSIPVLDRAELDAVLASAMGPEWVVPPLAPRPPAARRRGITRRTVPLAAVLLPMAVLAPPWSLLVPSLAVAGVWWGREAHRRAGFAEVATPGDGPGMVAVAHGVLVHRIDLVPVARIQSCTVSESPLQRRASLRTVRLNVAGARPDPELYDLDGAQAMRWLVELPRRSAARGGGPGREARQRGVEDGANASHPPPAS